MEEPSKTEPVSQEPPEEKKEAPAADETEDPAPAAAAAKDASPKTQLAPAAKETSEGTAAPATTEATHHPPAAPAAAAASEPPAVPSSDPAQAPASPVKDEEGTGAPAAPQKEADAPPAAPTSTTAGGSPSPSSHHPVTLIEGEAESPARSQHLAAQAQVSPDSKAKETAKALTAEEGRQLESRASNKSLEPPEAPEASRQGGADSQQVGGEPGELPLPPSQTEKAPDSIDGDRSATPSDIGVRAPVQAAAKLQAIVKFVKEEYGAFADKLPEEHRHDGLKWRDQFLERLHELDRCIRIDPTQAAEAVAESMRQLRERLEQENGLSPREAVLSARGQQPAPVTMYAPAPEPVPVIQEEDDQWADAEAIALEMAELRRVRRQIRTVFGNDAYSGMRVDDLLSERSLTAAATPANMGLGVNGYMNSPGIGYGISSPGQRDAQNPAPFAGAPPAFSPYEGPTSVANSRPPLVPQPPPSLSGASPAAASRPHRVHAPEGSARRPPSGGTEVSSITNSSDMSWQSQGRDDERRRREKKERKHRRHRRDEETYNSREARAKPEDVVGLKHRNWAEEVVRASLDPQNQWDFPSAGLSAPPVRAVPIPVPSWEQPRQVRSGGIAPQVRGNDVASRAWERAEQVQRLEREQHRDPRYNYESENRWGSRPYI